MNSYTEGTLAVQPSLQNLVGRGQHPDSVPFARQLIEDLEPDDDDLGMSAKRYVHRAASVPDTAAKYGFEDGRDNRNRSVSFRYFDTKPIPLKPNSSQTVTKIKVSITNAAEPHYQCSGAASVGSVLMTVRFGNIKEDGKFWKFGKWTVRKTYYAEPFPVSSERIVTYDVLKVLTDMEPDIHWLTSLVLASDYKSVYNLRCRLYSRGFRKMRHS